MKIHQNLAKLISFVTLILVFGFPCKALLAEGDTFQVLHFTSTSGFNHGTANVSLTMFSSLGNDLGFTVTQDSNGSEFNSLANLHQYAVVVFSNTSGNNILNASQRANFEAYIESGGSYLGIHAASDTYRHSSANGGSTGTWDWYAENVAGCSVQTSPNHTSQNHSNMMTHSFEDHPVLDGIPDPWFKTEEYYYWENGYLNSSFTTLLTVGQTGGQTYDAARMTTHVKELAWGGRAFYTSLGHAGSNFSSDQHFVRLMENAVIWTADPSRLGPIEIEPSEFSVTRGSLANGSLPNLLSSDDADVSIRRSSTDIESVTAMTIEGTSPLAIPSSIEISLEGSVFARTNVVQTISLFNYATADWVDIDVQNAARFSDATVQVTVTDDTEQFVSTGDQLILARVRYQSDNPRQRFTSNTDQFKWVIQP